MELVNTIVGGRTVYKKGIHSDRDVEYKNRFDALFVSGIGTANGDTRTVEVTRNEGTEKNQGTPFNKTFLNGFEQRISDGLEDAALYAGEVNTNLRSLISTTEATLRSLILQKADISHASAQTTYGVGTNAVYGHVKLSDSYASSAGAASNSVAASSKAVADAYSALDSSKAPTSHAVNADTYGIGNATLRGHVMLSAATNSTLGVSGKTAATPSAVKTAYDLANSANATANNSVLLTGNQSVSGTKTFAALRTNSEEVLLGRGASSVGARGVSVGMDARSGNNSVSVGFNASSYGESSTAVGDSAQADASSSSAFGYSAISAAAGGTAIGFYSNTYSGETDVLQLGSNSSLSSLRCRVGLSTTSDERDKADIVRIRDGLEVVRKVSPIQYVLNHRTEYIDFDNATDEDKAKYSKYGICKYDYESYARGDKKGQRKRIGISAQEMRRALADVYGTPDYADVVNDNLHDLALKEKIPDDIESQLTVNHTPLVLILWNAVQELSEIVRKQQSDIDYLLERR